MKAVRREAAERRPVQTVRVHSQRGRLPTFEVESHTLLKRATLVLRDGRVEHVFYPVFPPDQDAPRVLEWLAGG